LSYFIRQQDISQALFEILKRRKEYSIFAAERPGSLDGPQCPNEKRAAISGQVHPMVISVFRINLEYFQIAKNSELQNHFAIFNANFGGNTQSYNQL